MEIKHETTSVLYIKEPKDFEVTLEVTVTFVPMSPADLCIVCRLPAQPVPTLGVRTWRVGHLPQRTLTASALVCVLTHPRVSL